LGDSITDGFATTRDADLAWPALLARRLKESKSTQHAAVVNQGISGNQVLRDGAGISALARLDRDVLTRPGVRWVILLEGINDINIRTRPNGPNPLTAEELIGGYRQIIERCHAQGIRVIGATLTPARGADLLRAWRGGAGGSEPLDTAKGTSMRWSTWMQCCAIRSIRQGEDGS